MCAYFFYTNVQRVQSAYSARSAYKAHTARTKRTAQRTAQHSTKRAQRIVHFATMHLFS